MTTRWRIPAGVALALLALTACGSGGGGAPGVASLGGAAGASATPSAAAKDRDQALLDFARCMRENGVDMPDPEPGGPVLIGPGGGGGGAPSEAQAEKFEAAQAACRHHLDGVRGSGPGAGGGPPAEMQEKMLAMARCMREAGYDMPDPQFGGGGGVRMRLPEGVDPEDPKFQQAQQECREESGLTGLGGGRS